MSSRGVTADDELLAEIDAMLAPGAGALAGFVDTVGALGDDAFQAVLFDKLEHMLGRARLDGGQADVAIVRQHLGKNLASIHGLMRPGPLHPGANDRSAMGIRRT